MRGSSKRVRLLALASVLGLAGALVAAAAPASAETSYQIENYASGLCLGISGGADNAPAVDFNCLDHPDQYWYWSQDSVSYDGFTWRELVNGDGECLGVAGGSTAEGADVVGWNCLGPSHPDQWWEAPPESGDCGLSHPVYAFYNLSDFKAWLNTPVSSAPSGGQPYVMGTQGGSLASGANLVMWNYQDLCNNQFWLDYPPL